MDRGLHCVQGSTLAGTLASLAAPLATAVAQLEVLTAQELEQDSWLKEGASKVAFLSQKLLECGALDGYSAVATTAPQEQSSPSNGTQLLSHSSLPRCTVMGYLVYSQLVCAPTPSNALIK